MTTDVKPSDAPPGPTATPSLQEGIQTADDLFRKAQHYLSQNNAQAAGQAFRQATVMFPENPETHHNLGSFLAVTGHYPEAETAYRHALSIAPHDAETWRNLAQVYLGQKQYEEAERCFARASEISPDDPSTRVRRGRNLLKLARFGEAVEMLAPAVAAEPRNLRARIALGQALTKTGRFDEHRDLIEGYLGTGMPADEKLVPLILGTFSNPEIDAAEECRLLRGIFGTVRPAAMRSAPPPASARKSRLKVAYFTNYLDRPNYLAFLDAVMAHHDGDRFDVTIYSDTTPDDPARRVTSIQGMDNGAVDRRIRGDGVDVLVDVNGFSAIPRLELLAMKPAPVIVSWFNSFHTLGTDAADWLLGDDIVTPPAEDAGYVERIWRLPGCYMIRETEANRPPVATAPAVQNGYCTFGALASDHKINARSIATWAEILKRVPGSRFLMRNSEMTDRLAGFYRAEFAKHGVAPSRLVTLGRGDHFGFLETYDRLDVALDSFPWNGGVTTLEALWQGVPVVTFAGNKWVSRAGATFLEALGRPEWVGATVEEYVEIAVALGRLPATERNATRQTQRDRMAGSILCDAGRFTRNLETAYAEMYRAAGAEA